MLVTCVSYAENDVQCKRVLNDFVQSMMQLLLLKLVTRNEMATINLHLDRIVRKAMVQRLLTIHLSLDRANQEVCVLFLLIESKFLNAPLNFRSKKIIRS